MCKRIIAYRRHRDTRAQMHKRHSKAVMAAPLAEPGGARRDAGSNKGCRSRSPSPRVIAAEDNEAVIKIIAKGRTPALRHLHRTHRIEVDWQGEVFANEGMLLKYVPTTLQIADMFSNHFTKPLHWERRLRLALINDPPESRQVPHRKVSHHVIADARSASPSGPIC